MPNLKFRRSLADPLITRLTGKHVTVVSSVNPTSEKCSTVGVLLFLDHAVGAVIEPGTVTREYFSYVPTETLDSLLQRIASWLRQSGHLDNIVGGVVLGDFAYADSSTITLVRDSPDFLVGTQPAYRLMGKIRRTVFLASFVDAQAAAAYFEGPHRHAPNVVVTHPRGELSLVIDGVVLPRRPSSNAEYPADRLDVTAVADAMNGAAIIAAEAYDGSTDSDAALRRIIGAAAAIWGSFGLNSNYWLIPGFRQQSAARAELLTHGENIAKKLPELLAIVYECLSGRNLTIYHDPEMVGSAIYFEVRLRSHAKLVGAPMGNVSLVQLDDSTSDIDRDLTSGILFLTTAVTEREAALLAQQWSFAITAVNVVSAHPQSAKVLELKAFGWAKATYAMLTIVNSICHQLLKDFDLETSEVQRRVRT